METNRTQGRFPAGLAVTALLITVGLFGFLHSPYFHITHIVVHGNDIISEAALLSRADIELGDNLLQVDLRALAARVATHPRVRHVNVHRRLPSTLVLVVSEHVPVALVVQGDEQFAVTGDGDVVPLIADEAERLPVIEEAAPDLLPVAIAVAAHWPATTRDQIAVIAVTAHGGVNITLHTRGDGVILLGDERELARKEAIAASLLQADDDYVLIDVRFPRSPAVRVR